MGGLSSSKRAGGCRTKEDVGGLGALAAATQPGVLSSLTIPQREAKQGPPPPRASQQAPPPDAILGAQASADTNPPTSTSQGHRG